MFFSRVRPLSTRDSVRLSGLGACVLAFTAMSASGLAEVVTLPAAASIVGAAPFFSDVRAFNTSYTNPLAVTARYRCFIPSTCTAGTPQIDFTLQPRESRAFDDMVNHTFGAPDTAGGVEFDFSGSSGQLVVTSRLYSTDPEPTVGMFIPGLPDSEAHPTTVLTSIRNLGSGPGFRTNVGVYNRGDSTASVTFRIFDGGRAGGQRRSGQRGGALGRAGQPDLQHCGGERACDEQRDRRGQFQRAGVLLRRGDRQQHDRSHLRRRRRGPAAAGTYARRDEHSQWRESHADAHADSAPLGNGEDRESGRRRTQVFRHSRAGQDFAYFGGDDRPLGVGERRLRSLHDLGTLSPVHRRRHLGLRNDVRWTVRIHVSQRPVRSRTSAFRTSRWEWSER